MFSHAKEKWNESHNQMLAFTYQVWWYLKCTECSLGSRIQISSEWLTRNTVLVALVFYCYGSTVTLNRTYLQPMQNLLLFALERNVSLVKNFKQCIIFPECIQWNVYLDNSVCIRMIQNIVLIQRMDSFHTESLSVGFLIYMCVWKDIWS